MTVDGHCERWRTALISIHQVDEQAALSLGRQPIELEDDGAGVGAIAGPAVGGAGEHIGPVPGRIRCAHQEARVGGVAGCAVRGEGELLGVAIRCSQAPETRFVCGRGHGGQKQEEE